MLEMKDVSFTVYVDGTDKHIIKNKARGSHPAGSLFHRSR